MAFGGEWDAFDLALVDEIEVLLVHRGELFDAFLIVARGILQIVFSNDHLIVHSEGMMFHLVLVVRGTLHHVRVGLGAIRRKHGFLLDLL